MLDTAREWFDEIACRAGLIDLPRGTRAALLVALGAVAAWTVVRWAPALSGGQVGEPVAGSALEASTGSAPIAGVGEPAAAGTVTVHVVGAVRHPGVYGLAGGSRACDALAAAGGALGCADTAAVNLARVVSDGEQIVFPRRGEAAAAFPPGGGGGPGPGGKVDLNAAGVTELDTLPGVGPATAQKIVSDRSANGPFRSVEDLLRVPGIGPAKLDALKGLVVVR